MTSRFRGILPALLRDGIFNKGYFISYAFDGDDSKENLVGYIELGEKYADDSIYLRGFALAEEYRELRLVNVIYLWLSIRFYFHGFSMNLV